MNLANLIATIKKEAGNQIYKNSKIVWSKALMADLPTLIGHLFALWTL